MYWILWDILIPLLLTFGLGALLSWMWWRSNRGATGVAGAALGGVFGANSSNSAVEFATQNTNGISASGLEAANIALIDERDKVASELADVKTQLEELSVAGSLSEGSSEDGDNLSTKTPGAGLPVIASVTSEQSQQDEIERVTSELETVNRTLDVERRAKREVELELLNANNRLEKLGGGNSEDDANSISIDRHREELAARDAQIRQLRGRLRDRAEGGASAETIQLREPVQITNPQKPQSKSNGDAVGWQIPERKPVKKDRDELTQIKGVGPALEKLLHKAGIYHFEQLAQLDRSGVDELQEILTGFPGRIRRDKWVNQARQLQKKKYGASSTSN